MASEIRRCILEEDVIADDASANLHKIRRSIQSFDGKIHSALNSMVNGSMRNYLQDAIVTMRETVIVSRSRQSTVVKSRG